MFYSQFILAKKGPLGTIWIAAHLERKLRKNQVTDTDIGVSVDSIIFPEVPIALRLSSHLMVGVVRIYSRKVNYLFHDCSEALLKIKQAFRSAAVDLPPEESTAPYHSITLPETFHLDDFELPEAEFQGDIDHHVSSKEQITLQDNPERTGYSTSEFGLDERFGDGSSSHMGFDLEEELLLAKDHPIELESGDGIIVQGQSSLHPTDMDVDDTPSKDEEAEAYNKMDDEPSSSSKQNQSNADDLRNNIPNWTGYNLRTPDLNDMLFHNEDDAGPSSSYYHPSPFPCDDPASPASPEYVSAQAPATPGLMEETVPSRVHESPVLSPQRKASPSSNEEAAKVDNFAAPPSDFLHSAAANANDAVGAGMAEFGLAKPVQVESSGAVQENLAAPSSDFLHQGAAHANDAVDSEMLVVNTEDIAVSGQTLPFKATMGSVPFVQNTSEPRANGSTETYVTGNPTHFNEGSVNMQGYNFLTSNVSVEPYPSGSTEPWVTGTEPHVTGHPTHFNEGSGNVQGYNLHAPNVFLGHNLQEMPPGMTHSNISTAAFQQNTGTIPQYMSYNDRPNDMFTSNFPERERMLSAPYIGFHQTNDLGQLTAEKGITESDGSNKIGSLSSRKRHLEDSMPAPESRTTENLSSRPHGQRTTDAIPNDDDILASILVGRTPGLVLDSTPLPPNASTSKRQRLTPKTALTPKTRTPKRRVKMDDAMVIHADIIRQQLISTEDIRRIRRKAPCTRTEIWMIEKGSLEDDIFREPIFSCMHKDLNSLHYRTYESVSQFTVHNREPQRQVDMSETNPADNRNAGISGAEESAALDHQPHMVLPDGAQLDATLQEATDTVDGTAAFGLQMPSDERDNNIEKVTEFGDGKEIPLVDETNAAANITAHVDTLDKDCHQDASADMQRNTNADTPLFVQDDITHDSATITDAPDVALHSSGPACAQAVDGREGELSDIVRNDINTFEDREMPTSEITGLEFTEHAPGFPQPTEDDNAASAMGENSGLQGNNAGSFMDMDNTGHDFTDMDNTDFGSAIHGVDTDDDGDFDEAIDLDDDDDEPNPDEFQSHDALSGWSSRTKGVARYLKTLFDEESGRGRKNVVIDHLVHGKSRKEASRMFFETLCISTHCRKRCAGK
uniref:Rad21/Rec8-like protein N-terminal domain-containing protein n=1 Tax=Aegilops tauschii subsp. strangulata TaxID=200361 RepID=A0A453G5E7_AEGTS